MSKADQIDPADAYDAFRWAFGVTMAAWRAITGKPGQTTPKQRERKARVLAAFDGTYSRNAEHDSEKARRKAAAASLDMASVEKIARKAQKHQKQDAPKDAPKGTKGKGKGTPAKRPAGAHVIAMAGIRIATGGTEPVNGQHVLYADACRWVNAYRADNPGEPVTGAMVSRAIECGEIEPARKGRTRKGKPAGGK